MIKLHIPVEQYGFIEVESKFSAPEDIAREYVDYSKAFKPGNSEYTVGSGLPQKEWNAVLQNYVNTANLAGGADVFNQMNENQQYTIQSLKKLFKRMKPEEEISDDVLDSALEMFKTKE